MLENAKYIRIKSNTNMWREFRPKPYLRPGKVLKIAEVLMSSETSCMIIAENVVLSIRHGSAEIITEEEYNIAKTLENLG